MIVFYRKLKHIRIVISFTSEDMKSLSVPNVPVVRQLPKRAFFCSFILLIVRVVQPFMHVLFNFNYIRDANIP